MPGDTATHSVRVNFDGELRSDLPVSVVLGAGGIRGLAHVGVLEVLNAHGFNIAEMIGTSVGAIIIAFYAAVGMDLPSLKEAGYRLRSTHLLWWALLRRIPAQYRQRLVHRAGSIPQHLAALTAASFDHLHHGVQRIGIVAYHQVSREALLMHTSGSMVTLGDAVRGAAAVPRVFPPVRCQADGRSLELIHGGVADRLPVDALTKPPFSPAQVLVVDISGNAKDRAENALRIARLRRQLGPVPVASIFAETLGSGTLLWTRAGQVALLDAGRRATLGLLGKAPAEPHPVVAIGIPFPVHHAVADPRSVGIE